MYPITTNEADAEYLAEFNAANRRRELAEQARAKLEAATQTLIMAIRYGEASTEIENLLVSLWSGSLHRDLTHLDTDIAEAAMAMIAARAFMGEDADCLLVRIINETDTRPPSKW